MLSIMCMCVCVWTHFSHIWLGDPMDYCPPGSSVHGDSPGENTRVGCHALLQGIFPTQGSNLGLQWLLHCRQILYHWAAGEAHAFHKTVSVVIWNPSFSIFLINSYEIFWIHLTFTRTCLHDLIFIKFISLYANRKTASFPQCICIGTDLTWRSLNVNTGYFWRLIFEHFSYFLLWTCLH